MALEIVSFRLGPMENNTFLVADSETLQSAVIDPSFDSDDVLHAASARGWQLTAIWLTHAHFDHIAGVNAIAGQFTPSLTVALHPADLPLWREGGGALLFGMQLDPGPEPTHLLQHGEVLRLGTQSLTVRHTPGHSPGHVVFHSAANQVVFCGDLIFYRGIGRADLPGGTHSLLLHSIRSEILTLPPLTQLLSGHGPDTTVREEMEENPFL
jgi:hydroxyacylglutathione hydrolase